MPRHLVITIHLHDDRYHGVAEWPPAPARVFQALVAGVARANQFADETASALEWLESLEAPIIAAPPARRGQSVAMFVPNNDADTLGGDLGRVSEIRTKKMVTPWLIEGEPKFLYAWPIGEDFAQAEAVARASEGLYQLGRGVDMAWARSEIVSSEDLDRALAHFSGSAHLPGGGRDAIALACPTAGSLASLVQRFHESGRRLRRATGDDTQLFVQPPKPRFRQVSYGSQATRAVYELRRGSTEADRHPWRLSQVCDLVERIRDGGAARLRAALPDSAGAVERVIVGRKVDGADSAPMHWRLRIVPLPSIGHEHADLAVRRVLVDVPTGGPLAPGDIEWAFSGLQTVDPTTGEADPFVLTPCADDDTMLAHYRGPARRWRTITPAALPLAASRRRIPPDRQSAEAKPASERASEEARAVAAVIAALRHAGIRQRALRVHVQREPFAAKGARAEAFAAGTRFAKERLWHLDLEFDGPVEGPIVLGDGRFLGLGLCAPFHEPARVLCLDIVEASVESPDPLDLSRAFRRAVMARVQAELGAAELPAYFTGHGDDGEPTRDASPHLSFQYDPIGRRLLLVPPHAMEHRSPGREEREHLRVLERAVVDMKVLRAGRSGILTLRMAALDGERDPLLGVSRRWLSRTPYTVNRHAKHTTAVELVTGDVQQECARRGLPAPTVTVTDVRGARGRGVEATIMLEFARAVHGPIVLGRTRHVGGGLFAIASGA